MPKPKTVLLWGQDDLLTKAMEMFLMAGQTQTWEVIRLPANPCISSLLEQSRKIQPDLVLLYQAKSEDAAEALMKLIADQPESRVITVSLENNVMQVYSKHSITVRQVSDLLSVMEDRYFSENPA